MARTAAEKAAMYEELEEKMVSGGLQEYSVPERGTFKKFTLDQVARLAEYWRSKADAAENGAGVLLVDMSNAADT